jgi:hypothetical protein
MLKDGVYGKRDKRNAREIASKVIAPPIYPVTGVVSDIRIAKRRGNQLAVDDINSRGVLSHWVEPN